MPIEKVDLIIKDISKTEEKDEIKVISKTEKKLKIGIFNFETGERIPLKLPHSEIIVETLAFLDRNKLIMISKEPLYRVYIFTKEDNKLIHQSTIKVESYDEKIFLSKGRLFIYDENLGSITKWDINTLKFEAYFLFNNSFKVDNMKLNDNGVLLFVNGRKRVDNLHKDPYPFIIDAVYLIASDIGARLLIVHHNTINKKKEKNTNMIYVIHLLHIFQKKVM
ncbi:hypothetical protein C2G38_2115256 [Gigaspora rosea]|uniref:Uncharacterized protein n=1 Tax=Gigaspora rosea TaxID=44941 RepID=A0A397U9E6_9GLOM|nr:hypothetical protein C2G38_2115256 [Gigaspora rosea]